MLLHCCTIHLAILSPLLFLATRPSRWRPANHAVLGNNRLLVHTHGGHTKRGRRIAVRLRDKCIVVSRDKCGRARTSRPPSSLVRHVSPSRIKNELVWGRPPGSPPAPPTYLRRIREGGHGKWRKRRRAPLRVPHRMLLIVRALWSAFPSRRLWKALPPTTWNPVGSREATPLLPLL